MPQSHSPACNNPEEDSFMPGDDDPQQLAKAALRSKKPFWEHPLFPLGVSALNFLAFTLIAGYLTLWMDAHNDQRYLKRDDNTEQWSIFMERYKDNRENDRKERESIRELARTDKGELNKRLDRQEVQLDTIVADIKAILRSQQTHN